MSQFWKPIQITKILQDEAMTGATVNNRVQVKGTGSRNGIYRGESRGNGRKDQPAEESRFYKYP